LKKTIPILLLFILSFFTKVFGQDSLPKKYYENIKKAERFYEAKEYQKSALAYSSAFSTNEWKGRANDRWNAACSWALAKNPDSAFFNLFKLASKIQFTEVNRLKTDTDLNTLHSDKRWATLLEIVQRNKDSSEVNFIKPVVHQLDSIFVNDQKYRQQLSDLDNNTILSTEQKNKEREILMEIIEKNDRNNLKSIIQILNKYGWLGPEEIGEQGSLTLFLVIQHADQLTQEKYLPIMREAVKNGKANGSDLALLEDRVLIGQGKKQIYGSQITMDSRTGQYMLYPIEDEINVNKRRASVGLEPIEEYVKHFGIKYRISDFNDADEEKPISISTSLIVVTSIFILLLIPLFYYKHYNWFWLFLGFCLFSYFSLYFDYYFTNSRTIRIHQGAWFFLSSSRLICEYLTVLALTFSIYKKFKLQHFITDVISIFVATAMYNYVLLNPIQKLFLPNAFIRFYYNILEPTVYSLAFGLITLIIHLIEKRRKEKV